ncbi:desulfoferrodoxin [Patescibacteria group bacterium]
MAKIKEVYRCNICGNIIEVLHGGKGELVCCGQPMQLLKANAVDAAEEKHVPVIDPQGKKVVISVGSKPHPMTEEHYIEWIELWVDGEVHRKLLSPGDEPKASFVVSGKELVARTYCNLHGLWKLA